MYFSINRNDRSFYTLIYSLSEKKTCFQNLSPLSIDFLKKNHISAFVELKPISIYKNIEKIGIAILYLPPSLLIPPPSTCAVSVSLLDACLKIYIFYIFVLIILI